MTMPTETQTTRSVIFTRADETLGLGIDFAAHLKPGQVIDGDGPPVVALVNASDGPARPELLIGAPTIDGTKVSQVVGLPPAGTYLLTMTIYPAPGTVWEAEVALEYRELAESMEPMPAA